MPKLADGKMWIGHEDYPSIALRDGKSGVVLFRLTVDVQGKVTDCAVVGKSGSDALDETTCRLARERGRYNPAIGADGRPVAASFITSVTWLTN